MYGAASAHRRTLRRRKVDTSARAGAGVLPAPAADATAAAAAAGAPLASRSADEKAGAREPREHAAAAARKPPAAQLHSMARETEPARQRNWRH
jgi:hypothetical protein